MSWVAFTMDEVLGVYPTKRAAIHDNTGSTRLRCRRIRPGAYELHGWDGVSVYAHTFFVETRDEALRAGVDPEEIAAAERGEEAAP